MTPAELARHIDHTLLKPEATPGNIDLLCEQAVIYGFYSVCVNPVNVRHAVARMDALTRQGSGGGAPLVISVSGFPLGASGSSVKAEEARHALNEGAREIDMVANIGALRAGDGRTVRADIEAVARVVHAVPGALLKVILETRALSAGEIVLGCRCCAEGEADFVKTSTGTHTSGGATIEDVATLHRLAAPIRVKAAGGIRTASDALAMIEAGAARLGTSSGCSIVDELRADLRRG